MTFGKLIVLLLITLAAVGCKSRKSEKVSDVRKSSPESKITGNFTISGAYALSHLVRMWSDDFMKINPGVKIEMKVTGTGQGIADLLDKKAELGMISRPLTDDEAEAGIWLMPVARDGVALIANQKNPYLPRIMKQGLSPDEIQRVFTADKPLTWGELLDTSGKDNVMVYTRADESGAADMLAAFVFRKASDLKGNRVTGDDAMINSIRDNPFSLGFCNLSFAFHKPSGDRVENIQIIPFDLDYDNLIGKIEMPFLNLEIAHRSIWLGIYPENLCRELALGTLGKPTDPSIIAFLNYVLASGQEIVKEAGLCELNSVYLRFARESLE
jgi:phosphate transport system substrate-binding protein